jgi:hypothetical protein
MDQYHQNSSEYKFENGGMKIIKKVDAQKFLPTKNPISGDERSKCRLLIEKFKLGLVSIGICSNITGDIVNNEGT